MQPNPTILKANRDGEKSVFPVPNGPMAYTSLNFGCLDNAIVTANPTTSEIRIPII